MPDYTPILAHYLRCGSLDHCAFKFEIPISTINAYAFRHDWAIQRRKYLAEGGERTDEPSAGFTFVTGNPDAKPPSALPIESSGYSLPPAVHDYLTHGAGEGERNEKAHWAAQQFRDARIPFEEALQRISARALADGLKMGEITQCVRSAYAQPVREPLASKAVTSASSVTSVTSNSRPTAKPPSLHGGAAMLAALAAAFRPDEAIAICMPFLNEDQEWKPGAAKIHTLEGWQKRLPGALDECEGGCYIGINPLRKGSDRRTKDNIVAFRHVLAEWDKDIPPDDQERRLRDSGLPISVLVTSGGRSVHGWVRVDAPDLATWELRRDAVFAKLQCDTKNKDISRVSRLPGFKRGEQEQRLLATNIGARSWEEWEGSNNGLPKIKSWGTLSKESPQPPAEVIRGVLSQGTKMMLAGPSKARKSWCLLDLCMSVAMGAPWMGFHTTQGKVLYLNFELHEWMLDQRLRVIANSRRFHATPEQREMLEVWTLRGLAEDISSLAPRIIQRVATGNYRLIVIDPLYKALGNRDENAAGDINSLMNELERIINKTAAALAFAHHFAKGDASLKESIDRASGSGVFSRDPDTILTLTKPPVIREYKKPPVQPPEGVFDVDITVRAHVPVPKFQVKWQGGHFDRLGTTTSQPNGERQVIEEGGMIDVYGSHMRQMALMKLGASTAACPVLGWMYMTLGISPDNCMRVLSHMVKEGLVINERGTVRGCDVPAEMEADPF